MERATSNEKSIELSNDDLNAAIGGKATYYEMGGHWYIVGHNKYGQSTGAVRIT